MEIKVKRYDIVQADLSGAVGSEQGGVRLVLIIQNDTGNIHSTTTIVMPFSTNTSKNPNQPTHTLIKKSVGTGLKTDSVLLGEQMRVISSRRIIKKIGTVTDERERIKCANGIKIFHHGGSTLQLYIPSIGRGRNIIKSIYKDYINPDNVTVSATFIDKNGRQYTKERLSIIDEALYQKDMQTSRFIFNIEETDEEVLFLIRDKNLDKIIDQFKPQISGQISAHSADETFQKERHMNILWNRKRNIIRLLDIWTVN